MAEAALSILLQSAFDGLCSLFREAFGSIRGLDKDVENLRRTLSSLQAILADAEKKQLKDEAVKNWLAKLKHVAYDIEDISDQWATEERELEMQGHVTKKRRLLCSVTNQPFRKQMADKIKDVNARLEAIAGGRIDFRLIKEVKKLETEGRDREKTDSFVVESDVYGRSEDKERLIKILRDVGKEGELSVMPIIGMGGLGKTTLAQLIYNDTGVKEHFDLRIWVCVSDDFDVRRLTKAILHSATGNKCDTEEVDMLQRILQEKLKGRKFLLVLDDVWDENPNNWDRLRSFLQAGATDSKVIVTTRSERVASIMGTLPQYHVGRLSDDDCWTLFKQRAFVPGQEENPKLIVLGKEIVKKCRGVPLAAKAVGSLMRFKTEERQWESFKENEFWNLPEEGNDILPALRLSYYQLPPQLKQCFAYCSIFPKDYIIETEELILLWMAEGFIQPTQGSEMEEIGRDYFNNLLWRSFFQEPEKDDDGNVVQCKMHDLMHDLAVFVSGDSSCSIAQQCNITSVPSECRHLTLVNNFNSVPSMGLKATEIAKIARKLRSLLMLPGGYATFSDIYIHLPCLRVLDLRCVVVTEEAVNSISRLKQLRYLHLSLWNDVRSLPESFSKLHNLQTLRLTNSQYFEELPRDMRRMTSLRHLQLDSFNRLTHMPAKMGELKYLQTLPVFIVDEQSGCNIRELQDLKLGGSLNIRNLENVRGRENAVEAKLNEKANLRSLTFSWSDGDIDVDMRGRSEQTLEGLQPHANLKCLEVEKYGGQRFPHWMGGMVNLKQVSLSKCRGCEQLPPLGQLPLLKSLHIERLDAVKCIGSHFYGDRAFPLLEDMTFKDMPNLEEWSESMHGQAFPCLQKLSVSRCPKLTAIPRFPVLVNLELSKCPELTAIPCFPRLEILRLKRCPKLHAIPCFPSLSELTVSGFEAEHLPPSFFQSHLSKLGIDRCSKLESLPRELGNLAALQKLSIERCDGLKSLRLQGSFPSLQSLSISFCDSLVSIVGDKHHPTSLETLDIYRCRELGSLPEGMEHLTSLKSLFICHCDKVTCLPEGLKHASMLQDLHIFFLQRFAALPEWIGNLSSLQFLSIGHCGNMVSLPSGLQHLSNLKSLSIVGCPELEKRCKTETGEDWHKIAHIPSVGINGLLI